MEHHRARLERDLAATMRRLRQIGGGDEVDDLKAGIDSIFEDGDRVQVEQSREMGLMTKSRLVERIKRLTAARRRLETGEYGICAECGEKIAAARLRALPEVETCVTCQEKLERLSPTHV